MTTFLKPNWPAPASIKAYSTCRTGGVSEGPYASFNLGLSAGDEHAHVMENRQRLAEMLALPDTPIWIKQIHSNIAVPATPENRFTEADASYTREKNRVCIVMTADCMPILLCNQQGTEVAAIHAGWRGMSSGIIEATIKGLHSPRSDLLAWLGPAIGPQHFEVGDEVRAAFIAADASAEIAFEATRPGHWLANLYVLAKQRLQRAGISSIHGTEHCTYAHPDVFFSHRRDQGKTGRMASLIWID